MQTKSEMINRIAELAEENAELKAKIKKYAELNEIDTRDYAALHNENIKLNAIIDGYQPRLQALKVEIAELQAYKDVNEDFKTAWEELKAENERLKEELDIALREENRWKSNCNNYRDVCRKQYQTLQEIKEIAEGIRNATYQFGQEADQKFFNETLGKILQKITKAEEE
jgi:chromosome segregation ATPase